MKSVILLIIFTIPAMAQSPLQVDTSVKDIKPKPRVNNFPSKVDSGYKPKYPSFIKSSYGRKYDDKSEFEKEQQDNMDTSARNTSP